MVTASVACGVLAACALDAGEPAGPGRTVEPVPLAREVASPAAPAPGRRVRRMTAAQFARSLEVATGQVWADFPARASALGQADFARVRVEGRDVSVAFERLVGDAARATCGDAVARDTTVPPEHRVVLPPREDAGAPDDASGDEREVGRDFEHLVKLIGRFHGLEVEREDDPRLAPYRLLLDAPLEGDPLSTADEHALRWTAVCVALVTHPDFFTY